MIISRSIHVAANGIISVFVIMHLIFFFLVSLPPALLPPQAVHLTRVCKFQPLEGRPLAPMTNLAGPGAWQVRVPACHAKGLLLLIWRLQKG